LVAFPEAAMECRKGFWLALAMWGAAGGCQHQEMTMSPGSVPPGAVVQKSSVNPGAKIPKTETLVKFGDFRLQEAGGQQYTQSQRETLLDEARKSYQEALKLDSKCTPAYRGLARLYAATDQYGKAIATFQKALKSSPKDAAIWYDLGLCYNHMQEWDKALDAVRKAANLDPENRDYANALGILLARAGRYHESLDTFSRVNGPAMAHYKLGCTLRHLSQPELGRQHLETALQNNPQLSQAQAMLSEMNTEQAPLDQQPIRTVGYTEPQPGVLQGLDLPQPAGQAPPGP
jgi:tetratricopeptide (TPR) repeat protein